MTIHLTTPHRALAGEKFSTATGSPAQLLAHGETIVIWDGDRALLGLAAATANTAQTAFLIRHSSGFLEVGLPTTVCDRLGIPAMPTLVSTTFEQGCRQCIGIDAARGVTTGISAADRAHTARTLADFRTTASDLIRPGHLVVVAVDPEYRGAHAVPELTMQLAHNGCGGLVFAELVSEQRPLDMADEREAADFAESHGLRMFVRHPAAGRARTTARQRTRLGVRRRRALTSRVDLTLAGHRHNQH